MRTKLPLVIEAAFSINKPILAAETENGKFCTNPFLIFAENAECSRINHTIYKARAKDGVQSVVHYLLKSTQAQQEGIVSCYT